MQLRAVCKNGGEGSGRDLIAAGDSGQRNIPVDDAEAAAYRARAAVAVDDEALRTDDSVVVRCDGGNLKTYGQIKVHLGVIGGPGIVACHEGFVILGTVGFPQRRSQDPAARPGENREMTDLGVLVEGAADSGVFRIIG